MIYEHINEHMNSLYSLCNPLGNIGPGWVIGWPQRALGTLYVCSVAGTPQIVCMSDALSAHTVEVLGAPKLSTVEV